MHVRVYRYRRPVPMTNKIRDAINPRYFWGDSITFWCDLKRDEWRAILYILYHLKEFTTCWLCQWQHLLISFGSNGNNGKVYHVFVTTMNETYSGHRLSKRMFIFWHFPFWHFRIFPPKIKRSPKRKLPLILRCLQMCKIAHEHSVYSQAIQKTKNNKIN